MLEMLESGLQTVIPFPACTESFSSSLLQIKASPGKVIPLEDSLVVHQKAALIFTVAIFIGICIAYRGHGVYGLHVILSQVAAIIATQLSTKALMNDGFKYPLTITSFHFACVFITIVCWRAYIAASGMKDSLTVIFVGRSSCLVWYIRRLAPIAVLQCINVGCNTWSLLYVEAGFNALIGILAPIVTAMVAAACGSSISGMGWFGICLAIVGDGLVSTEGTRLAMRHGEAYGIVLFGIGLGISAMLARSVRTVLIDCQMNVYAKDADCPKLSPIELAALLSPSIMCMGILNAVVVEGVDGFKQLLAPWHLSLYALSMLILSTTTAVYLTIMGLVLVKLLGASAAQIAGKLNILVTIALSSAFLGESLSALEILGGVIVLIGATIFEFWSKPSTVAKLEG